MKGRRGKPQGRTPGAGSRRRGAVMPGSAAPRSPAEPSALLEVLKRLGPQSIRELAVNLGITYEAVRQQIAELERTGWVASGTAEAAADSGDARNRKPGPASRRYRLSTAAEHVFPKHYDELTAELLALVRERYGGAGLTGILSQMTEARVRHWVPLLKGLDLKAKLKALTAIYEDKDAYMQVEWRDGAPALIERNCPFLNVAQRHPAICSVTVNTLERLLGCRVVREQRFQAGHGRCVFRLRLEEGRPAEADFTLEP